MKSIEEIAKGIYNAGVLHAEWTNKSIVPEMWEGRDEKFKTQFKALISNYLAMDKLPTPEESHDLWLKNYTEMGWKYGEKRDPVLKTHPDMVPYDQLPKDEQDKDADLLSRVWLVKNII